MLLICKCLCWYFLIWDITIKCSREMRPLLDNLKWKDCFFLSMTEAVLKKDCIDCVGHNDQSFLWKIYFNETLLLVSSQSLHQRNLLKVHWLAQQTVLLRRLQLIPILCWRYLCTGYVYLLFSSLLESSIVVLSDKNIWQSKLNVGRIQVTFVIVWILSVSHSLVQTAMF